jgi:hypothetical protein
MAFNCARIWHGAEERFVLTESPGNAAMGTYAKREGAWVDVETGAAFINEIDGLDLGLGVEALS